MTTREFERIQKAIEDSGEKKAKAEGVMESIENTWKEDYELSGVEEVKEEIESLEKKTEKMTEKINNLYQELEDLVPENVYAL